MHSNLPVDLRIPPEPEREETADEARRGVVSAMLMLSSNVEGLCPTLDQRVVFIYEGEKVEKSVRGR